MSVNSFLEERATGNIIKNVASFCSECYSPLLENQIVFYDMQHYRYLCSSCQESITDKSEKSSNLLDNRDENSGLFI